MVLTAESAARLLGASRRTVFNMLKDGRLASLALEDVVALVYRRAYEAGRSEAVEELRRSGRLRRRDHKAHCLKVST